MFVTHSILNIRQNYRVDYVYVAMDIDVLPFEVRHIVQQELDRTRQPNVIFSNEDAAQQWYLQLKHSRFPPLLSLVLLSFTTGDYYRLVDCTTQIMCDYITQRK